MAHELKRAVGYHLIGIHVDRGASASLHHVDRELVVELSVDDLTASSHYGIGYLRIESPQLLVGLSCSKLDACHSDDIFRIVAHPGVGNLVVVESPLGLDSVISIGRNLEFSKQIRFNPVFSVHDDL